MKAAIAVATAVVAAALIAPALASPPPFPMNPYPGPSADYAFYLQTLVGHGSKVKVAKYCAQQSVFRRGTQVVFRMIIFDTHTGKVMTGKDVSKLVLKIQGQPDMLVPYRPQGSKPDATSPWMWSKAWIVPSNYPLGKFKFSFVGTVKKTKKTFTYDPIVPGTAWEIIP